MTWKKNLKLLILSSAITCVANAKPVVVAVIDTGITEQVSAKISQCKFGNRDFTGTGLTDRIGHGSHVSGLIDLYAKQNLSSKQLKYCQVILKVWEPRRNNSARDLIAALNHAININVDVINISMHGEFPSNGELQAIKLALDKGIKIVVSAGNEGKILGETYHSYPAEYDSRIIVVGNLNPYQKRELSSNYGPLVTAWEIGEDVTSYCLNGKWNCKLSGTSMSTPIKTGKIINSMIKRRPR